MVCRRPQRHDHADRRGFYEALSALGFAIGTTDRTGHPDDIAGVAVFPASEDARWLTGERITASGGLR